MALNGKYIMNWLLACGALAWVSAQAQPVAALAVGDEWVYRHVTETPGGRTQVDARRFRIHYANKQGKLVAATTAADARGGTPVWNHAYFTDANACLTDVLSGLSLKTPQPCTLPAAGTTWESNSADSLSAIEERYKVLGRETVSVGGVSYEAIKVEVLRKEAEVAYPGVDPQPPRRERTLYWFAREVNPAVKVVRETLDAAGSRIAVQTSELQSFTRRDGLRGQ